jgi:excisionase family DNA binding protein
MKATYSVREAADLLDISLDTAYDAVRRGQIKSIKIGKNRIRIPKVAFDRMLAEGNQGTRENPEKVV